MQNVTALIIAYNARETIERALTSAFSQVDTVILVDDCSTDGTAEFAQSIATGSLNLIKNSKNLGTGGSRQVALRNCKSKYAIWLDADDMFLPGRVEHAVILLDAGADYVFDSAELFCGVTGKEIKALPIPEFMFGKSGIYYQIERNYIPSLGWPAVRTDFAQSIGYNNSLRGAEDYDHFLRALLFGAKIEMSAGVYYRQYAYMNSVSRDVQKMNENVFNILKSLGDVQLKECLYSSGLPLAEIKWIWCNYLIRQKRFEELLLESHEIEIDVNSSEIKAAINMPLPYPYQWKALYCKGVALLFLEQYGQAEATFRKLNKIHVTAEGLNNLGVALARQDKQAQKYYKQAIALKENYVDAIENASFNGHNITSSPLRIQLSRDEYNQS